MRQRRVFAVAAMWLIVLSVNAWSSGNLIAYYPFSGSANDASGNGLHGTVNGVTVTADRFGAPNSAYGYDGVDDHIFIPDNPLLEPISGIIIEVWLYPTAYPTGEPQFANKQIIYKPDQYQLVLYPDGAISFGINRSGWTHAYSSTPLLLNAWTQVKAEYCMVTGNITIFLNNVLYGTANYLQTSFPSSDSSLYVGRNTDADSGYYFTGILDDLKLSEYCCEGFRGNVNATGNVTVADITYLVSFLFNSGPEPLCWDEGNVNGIGSITVADLTFLVQYLFNGGQQPPQCP